MTIAAVPSTENALKSWTIAPKTSTHPRKIATPTDAAAGTTIATMPTTRKMTPRAIVICQRAESCWSDGVWALATARPYRPRSVRSGHDRPPRLVEL